jgi:hypothetical protein
MDIGPGTYLEVWMKKTNKERISKVDHKDKVEKRNEEKLFVD